jgi:hypothetical protein
MATTRILALGLVIAVAAPCTFASQGRVDEAASWVAVNCVQVSRSVLSIPRTPSAGATVELRLSGEFIPETLVVLRADATGSHAEILQASGVAICDQLLTLRRKNPGLSAEEAASLVRIDRRAVESREVRELEALLQQAFSLRLRSEVGDRIYFPNRSNSFSVSSGREEVRVKFNLPEPLADSVASDRPVEISQPELADWTTRLLRALKLLEPPKPSR